jgi:hypothetical protein
LKKILRPIGDQKGQVLVGVLIVMVFFTILSVTMVEYSFNHFANTKRTLASINALALAEAGADSFMYNINAVNTYSGTPGPVTLYNDAKGKGTYETSSAPGSIANEKIVTSIGKVYIPATSSTPKVIRKVRLIINGSDPSPPPLGPPFNLPFVVSVGSGGITLNNQVTINNGLISVNGPVLVNNRSQIGTPTGGAKLWAANYYCPNTANSSYPQACATDNPITIGNNAAIYGDIKANNQTNTTGITSLSANSGVTPVILPDYDRATQQGAITSTITAGNASCNGGSKVWPANLHITGTAVQLTNGCTVTVEGNVWIDGTLSISNNSTLIVGSSVTVPPTIMIDGYSAGLGGGLFTNNATIATNATLIGFNLITFYSRAACSPNCSAVTGADLYNSANTTTVNINNNASAAGSVIYARWSGVFVNNGGSFRALLGQALTFNNGQTILGGSGSSVWTVGYYQQAY